MEPMLNLNGLDTNIFTDGVWEKICLAFPVLANNVGVVYILAE
jgi:hypothetical protein